MVTKTERLTTLLVRYQELAQRFGVLWERHQGKGWSDEADEEFCGLRDEKIAACRAEIIRVACCDAEPQPAIGQTWHYRLPGASALSTNRIDDLTERTISFKGDGIGERAVRYDRKDVRLVELVKCPRARTPNCLSSSSKPVDAVCMT